ncbi:MAG: hypothetical protein P4L77_11765 [Sulfuriferula sp.]|nr:hypothetical protein [Sulfuriferula sp.]
MFDVIKAVLTAMGEQIVIIEHSRGKRWTTVYFTYRDIDHTKTPVPLPSGYRIVHTRFYAAHPGGERILCNATFEQTAIHSRNPNQPLSEQRTKTKLGKPEYDLTEDREKLVSDITQFLKHLSPPK